jgi:Ca2+-transporting ATPase
MSLRNAPKDFDLPGLTEQQVLAARLQYGRNEVVVEKNSFLKTVVDIVKEPMTLLLLLASCLYFISGETANGIFMTAAILLVMGISLFQQRRSRHALDALKTLTQPIAKVIRSGKVIEIRHEEIVVGDFMLVEEGTSIPADGVIVQAHDFSVNESVLSGESMALSKTSTDKNNLVYQGTTVAGGLAVCEVNAIGINTALGKIGQSLIKIKEEETPLQKQISNFVKAMAIAGAVVFFIVWGVNFYQSHNLLNSLLKALTLAMSILPEEIPVAFTSFMALGAWRLMKQGVIVKNIKTVETLGSATVICTDKTGTITENRMSLAQLYIFSTKKTSDTKNLEKEGIELITDAMWASEPVPFDPMEIALHEVYGNTTTDDKRKSFQLNREYPLSGKPPMMTHVFANASGERIIATKGAPEAIVQASHLNAEETKAVNEAVTLFTSQGFRVLGVGVATLTGDEFPALQQDIQFQFKGLVAFYDPPKMNIEKVFASFYRAGIDVKIITGDNAETTSTIAKQIHFHGADKILNGDALLPMSESELNGGVMNYNLFTRMFPDAKLRILNALKANHQIVAMTGDGVNDAPALKAAHIGIAMGKKGTEIAKEVSSLILMDDDLGKMVDAIAMGRKIYVNLKKAIQYIISIHIPIILTVFIPLILGWIYPAIFSPVHIIFLEIIMGPTCSILYENEPIEKNAMLQMPRSLSTTFFNWKELSTSIVQGLVITLAILGVYQYAVGQGADESLTRTMVFITLISSNIFLTLENRSLRYSMLTTLRYKNNLVPITILITVALAAALLYIPVVTKLFVFEALTPSQLIICFTTGFVAVVWLELVKLFIRIKTKKN